MSSPPVDPQRTRRTLKSCYAEIGWSRVELAQRSGVHRSTILRIEKGQQAEMHTAFKLLNTINAGRHAARKTRIRLDDILWSVRQAPEYHPREDKEEGEGEGKEEPEP